jgi:outer membrane protein TolC
MGMITLEELRSIENEYINAELNYLRALKNYNLTAIELGKYIGNIDKIMEELL